MRFYKNVAEHIQIVTDAISNDIGIQIIDKTEIDLNQGGIKIGFVVGDLDHIGYTELGQERTLIELELQLYVPMSKKGHAGLSSQLYTAAIASKITGLLSSKVYGLPDQKERAEIEQSVAIANANEKGKSFCVRSIVFNQVAYIGVPMIDEYSLDFGLHEVSNEQHQ